MSPNRVTVDAAQTSAVFMWPTDSTAGSYQIDIYKDGTTFCHITLGPTGILKGISFGALAKRVPAEAALPTSLSFQVTGLEEATRYNYVLSALDANGTPLHVYIGDFATTGYTGDLKGGGDEVIPTPPIIPSNPEQSTPTDIESIALSPDQNGKYILLNGEIRVFRDGHIYSLLGQEIR